MICLHAHTIVIAQRRLTGKSFDFLRDQFDIFDGVVKFEDTDVLLASVLLWLNETGCPGNTDNETAGDFRIECATVAWKRYLSAMEGSADRTGRSKLWGVCTSKIIQLWRSTFVTKIAWSTEGKDGGCTGFYPRIELYTRIYIFNPDCAAQVWRYGRELCSLVQ